MKQVISEDREKKQGRQMRKRQERGARCEGASASCAGSPSGGSAAN